MGIARFFFKLTICHTRRPARSTCGARLSGLDGFGKTLLGKRIDKRGGDGLANDGGAGFHQHLDAVAGVAGGCRRCRRHPCRGSRAASLGCSRSRRRPAKRPFPLLMVYSLPSASVATTSLTSRVTGSCTSTKAGFS